MISYRFRRRAFLTALSGGVGLKIMLRNLEGSAQGMPSPGRLLITHWPVGIVAGQSNALVKPTSGSVGGSLGLQPFADAGLGPDMTVIRGLSTSHLLLNGGGGHEGGTVVLMTGRSTGGTRTNRFESDDAFAAPGGSIDQVLLDKVPALQRSGPGYANSIADSRTDRGEISTKCLSYSTRAQAVMTYAGGVAQEAVPLMPILSPLQQFTTLFAGFMPATGTAGLGGGGSGTGGSAGGNPADAMLKRLVGRRSVLDFAIEELDQVRRLAPSETRNKLRIHSDAVIAAERSVVDTINTRYPNTGGGGTSGGVTGSGGAGGTSGVGDPTCTCLTKPVTPPSTVIGMPDPPDGVGGNFSNTVASTDDSPIHAQAGAAHLAVLKAAFICDLIRVGTYQWCPGTNHVSFPLFPGDTRPYYHHPTSHKIGTAETTASTTPDGLNAYARFLYNVQLWYFARQAENLVTWKNSVDGCGNNLLDFTCVPFLTEVATTAHDRNNMLAMIIGGKRLGFLHDRYVAEAVNANHFWGTIAQAFGHTSTDPPFGPPLPGFWAKP